jgi:hypothetical protein
MILLEYIPAIHLLSRSYLKYIYKPKLLLPTEPHTEDNTLHTPKNPLFLVA